MPLDGYLWLGGAQGISGEAKHHRYPDWVGVSDLEWGVRQDANVDHEQDEETPAAVIDAFSFTHELDRASVGLFQACCTGRQLEEITFVALQPDGSGGQKETLRIEFRNCLIVSVDVNTSGASVTEKVEVVFGDMDIDARERKI